jgi:multicomponent Na+:H+ antiporter subunit E
MHAAGFGIALFALWLLLSGHGEPFLIALGVLSTGGVLFVARRMGFVGAATFPPSLLIRLPRYWLWLAVEIVKSNIAVARVILDPRLPIAPEIVDVAASQRSEIGRVTFANSITLTPGTISLALEDDKITVHALTREAAADLATGEMDRRVTAAEGSV